MEINWPDEYKPETTSSTSGRLLMPGVELERLGMVLPPRPLAVVGLRHESVLKSRPVGA